MLEKYEREQNDSAAKKFTSDGRLTGVNNNYDPSSITRGEYSNRKYTTLSGGAVVNPKVYTPGYGVDSFQHNKPKNDPYNLKNVDRGLYDILLRDRENGTLATGSNSLPLDGEIDDLIQQIGAEESKL